MKVSKDALRAARQLFRVCIDGSGKLHLSRAKQVVKRIAEAKPKPRNYLGILTAFQRLLRLEVAKRTALIESVTELDAATREQLRGDLQKKYGEDLTFQFATNPELIGGMRVKVGSQVWDGSVRAKLDALREKLA